jgi:hypothetical protein
MPDGLTRLDELMASMKRLERRLFAHVLGSFAFTLLAVLAQYDRFDVPFKALTELVGGMMGAAGILTCYLGSFRPPEEETDAAILRSRPVLLGVRTGLLLTLAAVAYYWFYRYAAASDDTCLLFLAVANFLFFYGLAAAALAMHEAELRVIIWRSMTPDQRRQWVEAEYERRQQLEELFEQARRFGEQVDRVVADARRRMKQREESRREYERAERRERRRQWREKYLWGPTLGVRRRLGLIRETETDEYVRRQAAVAELESKQRFGSFRRRWFAETVQDIGAGKYHPRLLDGVEAGVYEVGVWKFVMHPTSLEEGPLAALLARLRGVWGDRLEHVVVVVGKDAPLPAGASVALARAGVELVSERELEPLDVG